MPSPSCPTCSKAVYFAEQAIGPGGASYHKACLACVTCKKRVETSTMVDRDAKIYCKVCYGKNFAPKGYGFGGGGSFLNTDSTISTLPAVSTDKQSPSEESTASPPLPSPSAYIVPKFIAPLTPDTCPRCTKKVYFAEQQMGPGAHMYHKACFKCIECNKPVDSNSIRDKESHIYCKSCHGKLFGPKGFGYGASVMASE